MKRRLRHLDHATDVGDVLALGNQLLGSFELEHDLFGCMPGAFHGRVPPVWPDENSHSPWTDPQVTAATVNSALLWVRRVLRDGSSY